VIIQDPINPSGTDFAAVVQLRDALHRVVLASCGEPDLGELDLRTRYDANLAHRTATGMLQELAPTALKLVKEVGRGGSWI
jgi:hypothetical protein